ncbi:hypothetical protein PR048_012535 [Dryococelus australis]|uniref:Uncharacterized protein n=1 Tax=Dryococelus australis TaxID=614101 RepID=A0ABQ9HPN4_9NEOP|nr:hypothetical protein PR048_012535 [Dryococelus australis]
MRELEKKYPQEGAWTNMFIEQTLMKLTKERSRITHGRGMTDSQRVSGMLSHSTCSAVTMAIHLLTKSRHFDSQMPLFDPEKQCIRKTDKSALTRHIDGFIYDSASNMHCDTYHVLEYGTLFQLGVWPPAVTYSDLFLLYKNHIESNYGKVTVIFDGYTTSTIKDMEQSRRMKQSSPYTSVTIKAAFFEKKKLQQQRFINMLGTKLEEEGHWVIHSVSDADTNCTRFIKIQTCDSVTISQCNVRRKTAKKRNIRQMRETIGDEAFQTLVFVHSLTGCDSTSSLFRKRAAPAESRTRFALLGGEWSAHYTPRPLKINSAHDG